MTNIKKYPKGHLSKADRKKRTIAKTVIALGMILGIGIVISSNFLYSGIQYFTQKRQLFEYGFGLFAGSPIIVCLSIVLFYKIKGKNLPRWVGFGVVNVDFSSHSNCRNSLKNNFPEYRNKYTDPAYSSLSGNIYNHRHHQ